MRDRRSGPVQESAGGAEEFPAMRKSRVMHATQRAREIRVHGEDPADERRAALAWAAPFTGGGGGTGHRRRGRDRRREAGILRAPTESGGAPVPGDSRLASRVDHIDCQTFAIAADALSACEQAATACAVGMLAEKEADELRAAVRVLTRGTDTAARALPPVLRDHRPRGDRLP